MRLDMQQLIVCKYETIYRCTRLHFVHIYHWWHQTFASFEEQENVTNWAALCKLFESQVDNFKRSVKENVLSDGYRIRLLFASRRRETTGCKAAFIYRPAAVLRVYFRNGVRMQWDGFRLRSAIVQMPLLCVLWWWRTLAVWCWDNRAYKIFCFSGFIFLDWLHVWAAQRSQNMAACCQFAHICERILSAHICFDFQPPSARFTRLPLPYHGQCWCLNAGQFLLCFNEWESV